MNWRFWQPAEAKRSNECSHLWSNWSDPVEVEVAYVSYTLSFGSTSDAGTREALAQTRRCLTCNFYQRRLI